MFGKARGIEMQDTIDRKNMPDGITQTFSIHDNDDEIRETIEAVYSALNEKGYNSVDQIVGYILSEDPTYITNYKNARSLIRRIDRYELLGAMLRYYLKQ